MLAQLPPDLLNLFFSSYLDPLSLLTCHWVNRRIHQLAKKYLDHYRIKCIHLSLSLPKFSQLSAPYPMLYCFLASRILFNRIKRTNLLTHSELMKNFSKESAMILETLLTHKVQNLQTITDFNFNLVVEINGIKQESLNNDLIIYAISYDIAQWLDYFYQKGWMQLNTSIILNYLLFSIDYGSFSSVQWLCTRKFGVLKFTETEANKVLKFCLQQGQYKIFRYLYLLQHPLTNQRIFTPSDLKLDNQLMVVDRISSKKRIFDNEDEAIGVNRWLETLKLNKKTFIFSVFLEIAVTNNWVNLLDYLLSKTVDSKVISSISLTSMKDYTINNFNMIEKILNSHPSWKGNSTMQVFILKSVKNWSYSMFLSFRSFFTELIPDEIHTIAENSKDPELLDYLYDHLNYRPTKVQIENETLLDWIISRQLPIPKVTIKSKKLHLVFNGTIGQLIENDNILNINDYFISAPTIKKYVDCQLISSSRAWEINYLAWLDLVKLGISFSWKEVRKLGNSYLILKSACEKAGIRHFESSPEFLMYRELFNAMIRQWFSLLAKI